MTMIDLTRAIYPDLSERRCVVAGGTGDVGEGIVRAWLTSGAEVVVLSRSERAAEELRGLLSSVVDLARLHFAIGDYGTFEGSRTIAQRTTAERGPVTDIVAAIGGWWQGQPLWEISEGDWQRYFIDMCTAHVAVARAWSPHLPPTGSYQLILGGSAVDPVPGASIISMQQAGLLMMRRALPAELNGRHRVAAQILGPVVTRSRRRVRPEWVSNTEVGLVTLGIAADPDVDDTDLRSYDKSEMLATLQSLGVYPR